MTVRGLFVVAWLALDTLSVVRCTPDGQRLRVLLERPLDLERTGAWVVVGVTVSAPNVCEGHRVRWRLA